MLLASKWTHVCSLFMSMGEADGSPDLRQGAPRRTRHAQQAPHLPKTCVNARNHKHGALSVDTPPSATSLFSTGPLPCSSRPSNILRQCSLAMARGNFPPSRRSASAHSSGSGTGAGVKPTRILTLEQEELLSGWLPRIRAKDMGRGRQ